MFICRLEEDGVDGRDRKIVSFILDSGMEGLVQSEPFKKMGIGSSPTGELFLSDVKAGPERLMGESEDGYGRSGAKSTFSTERSGVAAMALGLVERSLELCLEYAKTRVQFDQPIGSFQVIQHRAVDLNVMCEVAQSGVREALALMDIETDPKVRVRLASRAKARAVTAAKKITRDAIQLHGAVGYTDEFDIGLYLNRSLVLSAWLGDDTYHRRLWFAAREEEGTAQ